MVKKNQIIALVNPSRPDHKKYIEETYPELDIVEHWCSMATPEAIVYVSYGEHFRKGVCADCGQRFP